MSSDCFDDLVREAMSARRAGWDFSFLNGRTSGGDLPWSYTDLAGPLVAASARLLDQDTGGGEILAGLAPFPPHVVATESWEPNVPVARDRLTPLSVQVRYQPDPRIPAADGEFDLVLNRHGQLDPVEIARVLQAGGRLLTQQVGHGNDAEFAAAFGVPADDLPGIAEIVAALQRHGLQVTGAEEARVPFTYHDIAAVVYQLLTVSWTVPGFTVERYDPTLRELDQRIRDDGGFTVNDVRYLIAAEKSAG